MSVTDPLLQPYRLKNVPLRNRLVSTSHEPAYGEGGLPKDRYRLYHVEKAKGGVGLTQIGTSMVSHDSPSSFGSNLVLYREEIGEWLRRLADEVHREGAAVTLQVTHLGRRTSHYTGDWLPALSASAIPEPFHRAMPKIAEDHELERIIADYAGAALMCREAGLDGIEIESYGHLFDGFLSPLTNHRDDRWGGDPERRLAFPRAVVQAIRAAVGPDFLVGLRAAVDEDIKGGLSLDEGLAAMRVLIADGIDFLSVIKGTIDTDTGLARIIPPMGTPSAPFLDFAGQVKQALPDIPIIHAARINDVATARHAVREGLVDLVGMTRAMMADPHIVNKIIAGQEARIRPCVGATYCLDALHRTGDSKCIHNASTGREGVLPHQVPRASGPARRAVVIGAGPAGLEAARVLAERGHRVTVLEANTDPGGQLVIVGHSRRRRDLRGIIDWRLAEAEHLGIDIRCGVYAGVEDVLALSPDLVIAATGGLPDRSFLAAGADLVTDSWEAMTGPTLTGEVLVFDAAGSHAGLDAAERALEAGARVEYVTPARTIAPEVGPLTSPGYLENFARNDTRVTLGWRLRQVAREGTRLRAEFASEYADRSIHRLADHVVIENGTLPNDELFFALAPLSRNLGQLDQAAFVAIRPQALAPNPSGTFQLFRIGDAVASRNVHAAIFDAARLCYPI